MKRIVCIAISILTLINLMTGCTGDTVFDADKVDMELVKRNTEFCFDIFSRLNEEDPDKTFLFLL
ncbi:hypothetical protein [Acetivibrio straminisolvens]|uniref:Uncharacterized protein n=1 Tax=Acetivibrio straminisolvens JCM 21531 TaxID=1294263 RepID=W4V7I1_9FIRM|nr:hypothetical protein [Acetivibrio straminisolvens]GAE89177.1 hypothetical protein JCM21531_2679 [Acetivibrio straminisolvens JCM 21531]